MFAIIDQNYTGAGGKPALLGEPDEEIQETILAYCDTLEKALNLMEIYRDSDLYGKPRRLAFRRVTYIKEVEL